MPDITCCTGKGCRDKLKCWRYIAGRECQNPQWQSFFARPPMAGSGRCRYFMRPPMEDK